MDFFPPAPWRVVAISVVVAAVAVTVAALLAIAATLGWIAPRATMPVAASVAPAAHPGAGMALSPGETLVSPAEAPAANGQPANGKPGPSTPVYRREEETKPQAAVPHAATPPPHARTAPPASTREGVCANCGTVSGTFAYPDAFAVSVHFEDGTSRTFRFASRPALRVGDKVFDEGGRLVRAR